MHHVRAPRLNRSPPFLHTPAHAECRPADVTPTGPRRPVVRLTEGAFPFIEEPTSEREIMNVEQARQMAKEKIEELAQELERGQSATLQAYLAAMAKFPRYSVNNTLLILSQRPDAQQCAGLRTWNRLGRRVLQGEHGIAILAPVVSRRRRAGSPRRPNPDETQLQDGNADDTVVGFRRACVFDVSQTEGAPVPEFACVAGNPGPSTDRLKAFAAERGITLEYSRRIAPARGACTGSTIVLLPDLTPAEHLSTLAHELGHALLHRQVGRDAVVANGARDRGGGRRLRGVRGDWARELQQFSRLHPALERRREHPHRLTGAHPTHLSNDHRGNRT